MFPKCNTLLVSSLESLAGSVPCLQTQPSAQTHAFPTGPLDSVLWSAHTTETKFHHRFWSFPRTSVLSTSLMVCARADPCLPQNMAEMMEYHFLHCAIQKRHCGFHLTHSLTLSSSLFLTLSWLTCSRRDQPAHETQPYGEAHGTRT